MKNRQIWLLSTVLGLLLSLQSENLKAENSLQNHSVNLFAEGLYSDSIPYFEKSLLEQSSDPSTPLMLATCYLETNQVSQAAELLSSLQPFSTPSKEAERLYLLCVSLRRLGQYQTLVDLTLPATPPLQLEKGIALYHLNRGPEAEKIFLSVPEDAAHPEIYILAQLYLARRDIDQKKWAEARNRLTVLDQKLPADHALDYEKTVLIDITELKLKQDDELRRNLGHVYLKQKRWQEADATFATLPEGDMEALFWRSTCAHELGNEPLKKSILEKIYTQTPQSPYAPLAFFQFYTYRQYVKGDRKAIKHLEKMPILYSDHPLTMSAYYLIGFDRKKNHLSEVGKIVRPKDLIAAIDSFQAAETTFDKLLAQGILPEEERSYYFQLRYRSMLERAMANLAIAKGAEGGKKQIYLQYAEGVFKDLIANFAQPSPSFKEYLVQDHPYPKILEEAEHGLAQSSLLKNKSDEADQIFTQMLAHYKEAGINQSYLLSRVWYEKGEIAKNRQDEKQALNHFFESEQTAGSFLSPDEKLDLWIQQSLCYKELHQLNESMRLLSKVVNDETISPLRIKAMVLRADIYELEGRHELALKQLLAASTKGGEWGKKAKERLRQVGLPH